MQEAVLLLDQLLKSKSFQEIPQVLKLAMSNLFKLAKTTTSKLSEHSQLVHSLLLRFEDTQQKLNDKTNIRDIQDLVRIVGKYEPFEDYSSNLDLKLTSRSRSTGLDRVMIEEVRTIAEALIEKKMEGIHRAEDWQQGDGYLRMEGGYPNTQAHTNCAGEIRQVKAEIAKLQERINQINQRKVDDYQLEQRVRQERIYLNQEIEKSSRKSKYKAERIDQKEKILKVEHDIENIRHSIKKQTLVKPIADFNIVSQLEELRQLIQKKPDKKEFAELKSRVQKDLTNKISLQDTQKIIKNFQQQIFEKLTQQRKQTQLSTHKLIRMQIMRNQDDIPTTTSRITEIKNSLTRVEKKIANKLISQKEESISDMVSRVQSQLRGQIKKVESQSCKQTKALFEIIQAGMEEDSKVSRFSLRKTKITQVNLDWAKWSCSDECDLKNGLVCWEKEDYNVNPDNFLWEKRKTQLLVVSPGIYELKLAIFCDRRPIVTVLVNNEPVRTVQSQNQDESIATVIIDFLLLQTKSRISIRIQDEMKVQAMLCLTKY